MVSFNCDACGDVVKKPKLDQHASRCQSSVTCLDCSTTFNTPAQWKSHTACISEAQKYEKTVWKGDGKKGRKHAEPKAPASTPAATSSSGLAEGVVAEQQEVMQAGDKKKLEKKKTEGGKKLKSAEDPSEKEAKQLKNAQDKQKKKEDKELKSAEGKAAKAAAKAEKAKAKATVQESTSETVPPASEGSGTAAATNGTSKKRKAPETLSSEELKAAKKAKRKAKAHAGAAAELEASLALNPYGLPALHTAMTSLLPEEALNPASSKKSRTSSAVSFLDIASEVSKRNGVSLEQALQELAKNVKVAWRTSARGAQAPLVLR